MDIKYRQQLGELVKELLGEYGDACEVGVAEGNFSKDLLNMGFEKLYMVDNWATIEGVTGDGNFEQDWHDANFTIAKGQVAQFGEKVVILRGMSDVMCKEIPDNSLNLVYLDGGHDFRTVWFDLKNYLPKLKQGGIMAGHDFGNPAYGVEDAVRKFCDGKYEVHVIPENSPENIGFWFQKI